MPDTQQLKITDGYLFNNRYVLTVLDDFIVVGEKVDKLINNIKTEVLVLKNAKILKLLNDDDTSYTTDSLYDVAFNIAMFGECNGIKIHISKMIEYVVINSTDYINISLAIKAIEIIYYEECRIPNVNIGTKDYDNDNFFDKLVIFNNAYGVAFIGKLTLMHQNMIKINYVRIINKNLENIDIMQKDEYSKTAYMTDKTVLAEIATSGKIDTHFSLSTEVDYIEIPNYTSNSFTMMTFTGNAAKQYIFGNGFIPKSTRIFR